MELPELGTRYDAAAKVHRIPGVHRYGVYYFVSPQIRTRSVFSATVDTIIFAVRSNTFMCDTLELSTLYCLPDMQT